MSEKCSLTMFIVVQKEFSFNERSFMIGVIYKVQQMSSECFELQDMGDGSSVFLPSTFHDNFLVLNEIIWGLERFSLSGISPEKRNKLIILTKSVEITQNKLTRIEGDLVVSFSDGKMSVRKFINNTVEFSIYEGDEHVRFDYCSDVFYKETFHPFTLDSREMTEKPETALVATRVEQKCLQSCSIQLNE